MLCFFRDRRHHPFSPPVATLCLAVLTLCFCTSRASAQTVASYDFEDGTADGWTSFNGASTPVATTAAAYSGTHSLLTTTSSAGLGGPAIAMTGILQPGAKYNITGYIELAPGQSASNADFILKRTDSSCSNGVCYDAIGNYETPVTSSGWVQIGGSYTVSSTATALTLYAQLVGETTPKSFYLDAVTITQTAPPPGGTPVATYTFADGTDGWTPLGSATLASVNSPAPDPNGNAQSLLVSNRTATYMGPSLNLLNVNNVMAGATYQVSAYVLLATQDTTGPTVTLSTKTADCATAGSYGNIGTSAALSSAQWTRVQGTFSFSDQPGPPTSLLLYLQSSSGTDSFYVSDVVISELAPPPPSADQQDNSGITSTFEDGGLDGWSSRAGATLTNTTAAAHTGTHSLLVTGRTHNYDGPAVSVSNKMYVGSVYNLSVWVMLQPTDGSNHIINMSLQTTSNGNISYPSITAYPGITVAADGQWHQISVNNYTMGSAYDQGQALLYLQTVPASGNDLVSFYVDDFQLTYVPPPSIQTDIPSIYQTLANDFPVGAAIDPTDLAGAHEQLLTKHFNSITSGNDMKWSSVEPSLGTYDFEMADSEVGLAVCHGMKIRGHNLVWATGAQTPAYATGDGTSSSANQETVTANIQEHIRSEVQHFGNQVYLWDVVNEPIDPSQPDCLAHGPFYQVLGKSYIDIALQAARQYAPPGTKLFINDYSTTDPNKLACLVKVVADLRSRGIPLDGIGHEMHNAINYPSVQMMRNAIDTVHRNFPSLEQQVTELDVSVYNAGDTKSNYGNKVPPAVIAEQGWLYKDYFDLFRDERHTLTDVTIWGMADDDTWLDSFPVSRTDYPLPFDMNLQAKPAYWGIVDPALLPGHGLHFTMASSSSHPHTGTITLTATNGQVGPAYATQITSLQLWQFWGPRCTPTITGPSAFPVVLGDIATGASASATFTVDLRGCSPFSRFLVVAPWSSATYHTGTFRYLYDPDSQQDWDDRH